MTTLRLSNRLTVLALIALVGVAAMPHQACAVPIGGLFTTGVDASGNALGQRVVDPHYNLWDGSVLGANAVTMWQVGAYLPNSSSSMWIWEHSDGQPTNVTRTFRTSFDLTGFDLTTARINGTWATDNQGLDVLINGVSTHQTSGGFSGWSAFTIDSGFVSGRNTLDFVVWDYGQIAGFRVGSLGGSADVASSAPTPELSTWALLACAGLFGLGTLRRRRRA